jgi:hypothetical protein
MEPFCSSLPENSEAVVSHVLTWFLDFVWITVITLFSENFNDPVDSRVVGIIETCSDLHAIQDEIVIKIGLKYQYDCVVNK